MRRYKYQMKGVESTPAYDVIEKHRNLRDKNIYHTKTSGKVYPSTVGPMAPIPSVVGATRPEIQPVRRFRSKVDTSGSYNNNQDWIDMQKEYGPEMRNKVIRSTQNPRIGAGTENSPLLRYGGPVKYQMKGRVKYISDPEEFKIREQAYNDSLTAYLESVDTFESLGPLQIPMSSGTIPRFEDIPRHSRSPNPHRIDPEIYIPGQGAYDVYTGERAKTEGYSKHFPSGNVIAPQISLTGGASGPTPGSGASMGYDFYPKPKQPVAFRKKPAFSPNRITPTRADDLAGYFRGGPDLKGADLKTVNTRLQPIQSNWRPKSVRYTSNTAAGYPMIQRGGGVDKVPEGAYWKPGKGYMYTE